MEVVSDLIALDDALGGRRAAGDRIVLVPTMGNLHDGHLSLLKKARDSGDYVVASIFVNPFQFGENEDFDSYPRTLDPDLERLKAMDCDLVFIPKGSDVYPREPERATRVEVPDLSSILCGQYRPGFFRGVATVVNILFNMVRPDAAVFGEKDYQQLLVIRQMVGDLRMTVDILVGETVREADGLAMSSRNSYLTKAERELAPMIFRQLNAACAEIRAGSRDFEAVSARALNALRSAGFKPDYFEIRRAEDLSLPEGGEEELRILAAAWLGKARLIDNVAV